MRMKREREELKEGQSNPTPGKRHCAQACWLFRAQYVPEA